MPTNKHLDAYVYIPFCASVHCGIPSFLSYKSCWAAKCERGVADSASDTYNSSRAERFCVERKTEKVVMSPLPIMWAIGMREWTSVCRQGEWKLTNGMRIKEQETISQQLTRCKLSTCNKVLALLPLPASVSPAPRTISASPHPELRFYDFSKYANVRQSLLLAGVYAHLGQALLSSCVSVGICCITNAIWNYSWICGLRWDACCSGHAWLVAWGFLFTHS